jgi:YDG domain
LAYNTAHVLTASQIAASGSSTFNIGATSTASLATDYSFTGPSIAPATTASITVRPITSSASIGGTFTKVYDGSTSANGATVSGSVLGGLGTDTLTLDTSGETLAYNNAHVIGATQIAASGTSTFAIGSSSTSSVATDYSFTGPTIAPATTATISPKAITSSASIGGTLTKVYDGNNSATAATVSGSVLGGLGTDTLTLDTSGETLAYNTAHVATANSIAASGSSSFVIGATATASVATDYSFTGPTIAPATTATITAKPITSNASIGGTLTKVYDGSTSATAATVSGSVSGGLGTDTLTLDTSGETLAYNTAHVATANSISASGSSSFVIGATSTASVATDYSFTGPTIAPATTASITAKPINSIAGIGGTLTKVYDGSTSASGAAVSGTVSGALVTDTLILDTSGETLTYNSAHVIGASQIAASGTSTFVIGSSSTSSVATDYSFTGPTIAPATTATISPKAITSSASIGGTLSKIYDGSTSANAATVSGSVSGGLGTDTLMLDTSGETLAYNTAHVATANSISASGNSSFVIGATATASVATDYSFTGPTIAPAITATITAKPITSNASIGGTLTKVYDGNNSATSATVSGSVSGGLGTDTLTLYTSGETLAYNTAHVATANSIAASGSSTFVIGATVNSSVASDYSFTGPTIAPATTASITAKPINSIAGIGGTLTKVYDGSTSASGAAVSGTVTGGISTDTLTLDTNGETLAYNTAHVLTANSIAASGSSTFVIGATATSSVATDYSFTGPTIAPATTATISPKAITSSASIGGTLTKVYDGSTSATAATVSGSVSGGLGTDTLTLDTSSETLTYNTAHVATANSIAATGTSTFNIAATSTASVATDYDFTGPTIPAATSSITAKALTSTITNTGVSKTYDGTTIAPAGFAPTYSNAGLISGDTAAVLTNTGAAYNSQNVVGASQLAVQGLAVSAINGSNNSVATDYGLVGNSASVAATIAPKALTVSGLSASSKVYDGSTNTNIVNWGSVSTGVANETLTLNHGVASFADANAALGKTVTASGYNLASAGTGASAGIASNYALSNTSTTTADITKALLTAVANNDAKFVTTADAVGYNGISYTGFVNAETATVIATPPSIARTNVGVELANSGANPTYVGVLQPNGGNATNYTFSYVNGDYRIVPANQLLVKISNINTTYGGAPTYRGLDRECVGYRKPRYFGGRYRRFGSVHGGSQCDSDQQFRTTGSRELPVGCYWCGRQQFQL